jgi:hypothetical protein
LMFSFQLFIEINEIYLMLDYSEQILEILSP